MHVKGESSMAESECIFCRIVNGEIPCAKVYEDDAILAFLDLGPMAKGHTLVVPKRHCENLLAFSEEEAPALIAALKRVGNAVMQATGAGGFHVLQNNFPAAGQTVFHLHWHIIPRSEGDGMSLWAQGTYAEGEMAELASSIAERM